MVIVKAVQEKLRLETELEVLYADSGRLTESLTAASPQPSVLEREIQAVVPTCSSPISSPPSSKPSASSSVLLLMTSSSQCFILCRKVCGPSRSVREEYVWRPTLKRFWRTI